MEEAQSINLAVMEGNPLALADHFANSNRKFGPKLRDLL